MHIHTLTVHMMVMLFSFVESGFILGGCGMCAAAKRMNQGARADKWRKFKGYFVIVHVMLLATILGKAVLLPAIVISAVAGMFELVRASGKDLFRSSPITSFAATIYICATATTICFAIMVSTPTFAYLYLLICVLDAYSQICGQLWGKHKLAKRISPNKSIEGALGGTACTLVAAIVFRNFAGLHAVYSVIYGVLISLFGILGDLGASWYKRRCGIKDYSALLPGQGGIIDRFNSLFAAAPVFLCFLILTRSL